VCDTDLFTRFMCSPTSLQNVLSAILSLISSLHMSTSLRRARHETHTLNMQHAVGLHAMDEHTKFGSSSTAGGPHASVADDTCPGSIRYGLSCWIPEVLKQGGGTLQSCTFKFTSQSSTSKFQHHRVFPRAVCASKMTRGFTIRINGIRDASFA
jgi:hypothetical protein